MPRHWLASKTAPIPSVLDWLKWSGQDLERHIAKSGVIGAIIGINKMGDIQTIYSPIVIPNAFASGNSAIIGNSSDLHTEPAFVYTDAGDIGSFLTVATYTDIPLDLRPEEHLSARILVETAWASAKVQLGMVSMPMVAPLFFGQKTVESSVHDSDFEDQLRNISPIHHQWAQLIKERLTQEENDSEDLDLVIERLSKSRNMKMITPGFDGARVSDSTFVSVFTLPTEKWPIHQGNLREFFAGNPSPVKITRPHSRVGFEPPKEDNSTAEQLSGSPAARKDPPPPLQNMPFDPMAFLKDWGEKMQMMNQKQLQPQTIVVESRADKSRENEAKYSNHMSQLLFICGIVDFAPPGSFMTPRIPVYTQAMLNILAQPSTVRASHTVNILTTCFGQVPTDLSERLSPLTTHKSMHHISKNLASALLTANVQRTSLDSLKFETSSITMLSFVGQNDAAKIEAHREAEQLAKNEREFDFVEAHRKILKTTIEGLGMISGMECIVKICANVCCVFTAFLISMAVIQFRFSIACASRQLIL